MDEILETDQICHMHDRVRYILGSIFLCVGVTLSIKSPVTVRGLFLLTLLLGSYTGEDKETLCDSLVRNTITVYNTVITQVTENH